jgi:MOSC domain-containing protein YiiM
MAGMDVDVSKPPVEWTDDDVGGTGRAVDLWWALLVDGAVPLPAGLAGVRDRLGALAEVMSDPDARSFATRAAAADEALALLSAAGRAVHAAGHGPVAGHPGTTGTVEGVFASGGGVPKAPVLRADVGWRGVEGDRQAARRHHGRVWQALSLWSADVVEALAAEGHPIYAGAAGENVSVRGIDWTALRPGTRVRLGTVVAEVSVPALPCAKNAQWFVGGDFKRMHHERDRAVTRWYATVLAPGAITPGDAVTVEPT